MKSGQLVRQVVNKIQEVDFNDLAQRHDAAPVAVVIARAAELLGPETGLKTGDVIHTVNATPIDSVDSLRADHLPAYGYRKIKTPAIDELASSGVVFERAFAHAPQTLPAHAALLSGRLPSYYPPAR